MPLPPILRPANHGKPHAWLQQHACTCPSHLFPVAACAGAATAARDALQVGEGEPPARKGEVTEGRIYSDVPPKELFDSGAAVWYGSSNTNRQRTPLEMEAATEVCVGAPVQLCHRGLEEPGSFLADRRWPDRVVGMASRRRCMHAGSVETNE